MMLRLLADVFPHRFHMHWADAEFTVARLPRKIGIPPVEGFDLGGRRRLDLLDNLRRRMVLRLREEDMDVVAHRVDFDER